MPRVFLSYQHSEARAITDEIVDALQASGLAVGIDRADIMPGDILIDGIEEALRSSDAVLAVITRSGMSSAWVRREIESALRQDILVIPVFVDITRDDVPKLPHELAIRNGITLDSTSPESFLQLAEGVRRAITARQKSVSDHDLPTVDEGRLDQAELADIRGMVLDAFAAADRPLRLEDGWPQMLRPGPVWISAEIVPTANELDRFADHLSYERLGYFVHVGELRRDAQIALDQMRVGGKPVVTITARSLRAAHADQRVDAFLKELERDYGNRDNLFDTKNALINERFLFGRDVLLNTIGSALRRNEHILVTGLRKVGKTSLLNILRQHLVDRPVCQVDLQRFNRHHEDWPRVLFSLMLTAFDRWGRTEHGDWPFHPSSPTTMTELEAEFDRRQLHLSSSGKPATTLVVVLDELERVYPAPGEQDAARQWIRASGALRVLAQGDRRHVVVIGADLRPGVNRDNDLGSAGTNPFFAFFQEMPVPLLDREAVDEMVLSLSRAMAIDVVSEDFLSQLFRLTGGHPSLIQTVAAEAYRQRAHPYALSAQDLNVGLDHLYDTDAIGFFLRNNLWQLMSPAEREVVRGMAHGTPVPAFVSRNAERQARSALRSQGLIDDGVRIGLFWSWLQDEES